MSVQRRIPGLWYLTVVFMLFWVSCDSGSPIVDEKPPVQTTITGKVIDAKTGSALSGATVSTEPPTEQTTTDAGGKFVIDLNVRVNLRYRVNAERSGYIPNSAEITAVAGQNTTSDIPLEKEQAALDVSPTTLAYGTENNSLSITIKNVGSGGSFTWTLTLPDEGWISTNKTTGVVSDNAEAVNINIDRNGLCNKTYDTSLSVTADNNAGSETVSVKMEVTGHPCPPSAFFTVSPQSGDLDTGFEVDASSSSDPVDPPDSLEVRWRWEVGEPFTEWASVKSASHQYLTPGTKDLTLEVKNTRDNVASATRTITVMPRNEAPVAFFIVTPSSGDLSTVFEADASNSSDAEDPASALQVRWRPENGDPFTTWTSIKTANHQYSTPGTKTITLEVRDTGGKVGTASESVEVDVKPGLVAYYPFNGNANDESGNGNHGVVCDSPGNASLTMDRFDRDNSAYSFDGNDCISLGNQELVNPQFSISVWVRLTDASGWNTIINKFKNISDFEFHGWYLAISPDQKARMTIGSAGIFNFDFAEGGAIGTNQWYHIVVTYDQSAIDVYVNAMREATTFTTRTRERTAVNLLIGLESANLIDGFSGSIDDIRIYDHAISQEIIEELFREGGSSGK